MPASPIRKLVPYAEAAQRAGKHVHFLNIGQPDIASPQVALEAIRKSDLEVLEYSHSAGFQSYREGLARYYQGAGIDVSYDQILVTTGGSEALLFAFMSCLDEGDEVIIPEPYYANYNGFATAAGVKVIPLTASIEDGFALPPVESIQGLVTERTRAILICNPGNPTGYLYSQEELDVIRDIVLEHDLFLFADEVYREFVYDGHTPVSVMNLPGIEQHTVLVDSVSKRYSMCGARIGALVTRNQEVWNTALKFAQARLSPPTLAQIAAEAALQTPASYFEEVGREYVHRRNVLVDGLNAIEGVTCPKPSGAFYCMAQLPVDDADEFCQWILEHFDYEGDTVMMAPASGFYADPEKGRQQVRLAYVLESEFLIRAVTCIKQGLATYPGRLR